jgi:hypothetical protein
MVIASVSALSETGFTFFLLMLLMASSREEASSG